MDPFVIRFEVFITIILLIINNIRHLTTIKSPSFTLISNMIFLVTVKEISG